MLYSASRTRLPRLVRAPFLAVIAPLLLHLGCAVAPPQAAVDTWTTPPRSRPVVAPALVDPQPDPTNAFSRDARAEALLGRIEQSSARVAGRAVEARKNRDVVRFNCTNDKAKALGAVEERAREKRSALRAAALDDPAGSDGAWAALGALETDAKRLEIEANQCIGEELAFAGDVTVTGKSRSTGLTFGAVLGTVSGGVFSNAAQRKAAPAGPAQAPPAALPVAGTPAGKPAVSPFRKDAHDASMLLRSAHLTLAVYEVDKKMDAVEGVAKELGGYLALRQDREITIRVPRERFDETLRRVEALGDVLARSVAAEDVTDQYVDLELRLKNAQAVRARLEKLLEAATVRDAVEIHKELAKVTDEIERLEGKIKLLRDRIAFSTIAVRFERTEPQRVKSREALLPFPWMRTMGLGPLLSVPR